MYVISQATVMNLAGDRSATATMLHSDDQDRSADMETRDKAEVMTMLRKKFMEEVAATANQMPNVSTRKVASPGGMTPHDM